MDVNVLCVVSWEGTYIAYVLRVSVCLWVS